MITAGLTAAVYHGTGYLIDAIYGGAMKAYRAKHTPAIPRPRGWATFLLALWERGSIKAINASLGATASILERNFSRLACFLAAARS